ncbi:MULTISPECIES: hypothetical protein [unclassified Mesorhizobium]|uniref:ABC transporter permease n=1 Tax=unclassified Mesorhizobium TaxID=325217 RepID=UPI001FE1B17C|nr:MULTISPECIES: hypothetical protein [unclassified Mesorhizobium]
MLVACLLAVVIFSVASPHYATPGIAVTVLRNSVELLLIGLGMTLLLAMGGIDVSIGIVMGLAAIAIGRILGADGSPFVALVAGPLVGALLGCVTAAIVVLGRVPAIVGTLGLFGVYRTAVLRCLAGNGFRACPRASPICWQPPCSASPCRPW